MSSTTIGRHAAPEQSDQRARPRHVAVPPPPLVPPVARRQTWAPAAAPSFHPGPLAPATPFHQLGPVPPAGLGAVPAVTPGPRRPMRWSWLALGAVLAVLAVGVLVAFAGAHRTMTVQGTVTIYGMNGIVYPGTGCYNNGSQGMPVSIYDASGTLVGSSSLPSEGTARNTWSTYSGYADSCELPFTAADVSSSSDYYRISVGSSQGQGVSFTRAQLESGSVGLTLH